MVGREPSHHLPADDTPPAKRLKPRGSSRGRMRAGMGAVERVGPSNDTRMVEKGGAWLNRLNAKRWKSTDEKMYCSDRVGRREQG